MNLSNRNQLRPFSRLLLWFFIFFAFALLAWLSLARYQAYNVQSFDLGAIGQAVWRTTQGDPLIFTHKGIPVSRLASHVEIFYFLLVPVYSLWPYAETLLIIQAAFFAAGAFPTYLLARRRLNSSRMALIIALVYLSYPVAQTAVLFEFHADTLAMPLLLFAIEALDRRRWLAYGFWLILALSCKFYVSVPVTVLGLMLWWRGDRRVGKLTVAMGAGWFFMAFFIIRPMFAPAKAAVQLKATAGGYLGFYFGRFEVLLNSVPSRISTLLLVYAPSILVGWRAWPWLVVAGTIVVPVILSSGPGPVYSYLFHHYALAVPFLMGAIIYGAEQLKEAQTQQERPQTNKRHQPWKVSLVFTLTVTLMLNVLTVSTPLSPLFYTAVPGSGQGWNPRGYQKIPRDTFKTTWLAHAVPEEAAIAADRSSALQLFNRDILYLTHPLHKPLAALLPEIDYVVVDSLNDFVPATKEEQLRGNVFADHDTIQLLLTEGGWKLMQAQDGLLLFGKDGEGLKQDINFVQGANLPKNEFENTLALIDCGVTSVGERRFQMRCEWSASRPLLANKPYMAVSRLEGLAHSRIIHLPTLALYPTTNWELNQIIQETFEFTLPAETPPGRYPLWLGVYNTEHIEVAMTDARSRLGDEVLIDVLEIQ